MLTRKERRLVHMRIEAIKVVGRYRQDLGDIQALANSIGAVGLLNPITVTSDGHLIAGQRRLEACRALGHDQIRAVVADDLDSAVARLTAERDENVERLEMRPAELVRLGLALEELERPKAAQRQGHGQTAPGTRMSNASDHENISAPSTTRDVVANAIGMSGTTYDRARAVVLAAQNEDLSPAEQELARDALADMNATGNISGNYNKVREAGLTEAHQKALKNGGQGLRQRPVIQDAKKQRHAIGGAVASLSGISTGLKRIEDIHSDITKEEAAQWVGDLSEARLVIDRLIRRLKERTNA